MHISMLAGVTMRWDTSTAFFDHTRIAFNVVVLVYYRCFLNRCCVCEGAVKLVGCEHTPFHILKPAIRSLRKGKTALETSTHFAMRAECAFKLKVSTALRVDIYTAHTAYVNYANTRKCTHISLVNKHFRVLFCLSGAEVHSCTFIPNVRRIVFRLIVLVPALFFVYIYIYNKSIHSIIHNGCAGMLAAKQTRSQRRRRRQACVAKTSPNTPLYLCKCLPRFRTV